jgi:uncharacterized lipoprotein YmbA
MKYITGLIILIVLGGCGVKHQYYMLSAPHEITPVKSNIKKNIGVETLEIPSYLQAGKVAVLKADNQLVYLDDALWAVDMQKDLTDSLIFDLQKSLPACRVFHYPWEGSGKIDKNVKIKITRFIARGSYVYLDAVVRINRKDKIISLKIPTDTTNKTAIIESMKKAFFALEREVINLLDDIKVSKKQR